MAGNRLQRCGAPSPESTSSNPPNSPATTSVNDGTNLAQAIDLTGDDDNDTSFLNTTKEKYIENAISSKREEMEAEKARLDKQLQETIDDRRKDYDAKLASLHAQWLAGNIARMPRFCKVFAGSQDRLSTILRNLPKPQIRQSLRGLADSAELRNVEEKIKKAVTEAAWGYVKEQLNVAAKTRWAERSREMTGKEQKDIASILRSIEEDELAERFRKPVDEVDDKARGYYTLIHYPMCLATIIKKLSKMDYRCFQDVVDDFELMIENAICFNPSDHDVHKDALKLRERFRQLTSNEEARTAKKRKRIVEEE